MTNRTAGSITIEVKPTVTLESAAACVYMLNMFLEDNPDYTLAPALGSHSLKWKLTDCSEYQDALAALPNTNAANQPTSRNAV